MGQMSVGPNDWAVLGLRPWASRDEVRSAFCALAREHHPDKSEASDAAARFRRIHEAYTRLIRVAVDWGTAAAATASSTSCASNSAASSTSPASSAASGLGCGDCEVNDSALWHEAYSMRVCDGCWKRWWS